jgi:soluble lytic murein transglycosylase-like protein
MTKAQIIQLVRATAAKYKIDPDIAVAQINQESRFNPNARSSVGAAGIAQFMPGTAKRFGLTNPLDPEQAMEAWGKYMSLLLRMFGGRYDLALAGYNWGENRATLRRAAREGKNITQYSIPAETKNYVKVIMAGRAGQGVQATGAASPDVPGGNNDANSGTLIGLLIVAGVVAVYALKG